MNSREEFEESSDPEQTQTDVRRTLRLFRVAAFRFALFAEDVDVVTEWQEPTPLPNAPEAILGVVCVQARMITVLDLLKLCGETNNPVSPNQIIALRGDEQLGVTADAEDGLLEISSARIEPGPENNGLFRGKVRQHGKAISILDPEYLFASAMRGRQRRRRHF